MSARYYFVWHLSNLKMPKKCADPDDLITQTEAAELRDVTGRRGIQLFEFFSNFLKMPNCAVSRGNHGARKVMCKLD